MAETSRAVMRIAERLPKAVDQRKIWVSSAPHPGVQLRVLRAIAFDPGPLPDHVTRSQLREAALYRAGGLGVRAVVPTAMRNPVIGVDILAAEGVDPDALADRFRTELSPIKLIRRDPGPMLDHIARVAVHAGPPTIVALGMRPLVGQGLGNSTAREVVRAGLLALAEGLAAAVNLPVEVRRHPFGARVTPADGADIRELADRFRAPPAPAARAAADDEFVRTRVVGVSPFAAGSRNHGVIIDLDETGFDPGAPPPIPAGRIEGALLRLGAPYAVNARRYHPRVESSSGATQWAVRAADLAAQNRLARPSVWTGERVG
jgi:hypothetical protein